MTSVSNVINGTKIEVELEKAEYIKFFPEGEKLTDSLVQFSSNPDIVTVDVRASDQYALWAATHEAICCGSYKHLAPEAPQLSRCGMIDLMLIDCMPREYTEEYRSKRLEMFKTLISKGLSSELHPMFRESIRLLEQR